ncbi:hypothetical protein ACQBAU_16125 [Propionibacteriaceae bacterium Y2011]
MPNLPAHLPVGTIVRRGNGTVRWRISGLVGQLIALEPVGGGYTNASVPLDQAGTLLVIPGGER